MNCIAGSDYRGRLSALKYVEHSEQSFRSSPIQPLQNTLIMAAAVYLKTHKVAILYKINKFVPSLTKALLSNTRLMSYNWLLEMTHRLNYP